MALTFGCLPISTKIPFFSLKPDRSNLRLPPTALPKASNVATTDRRLYWASVDADISAALLSSLPTSPPPEVTGPLRRLISTAPPTAAPALCIASCELVGGPRDAAIPAACAVLLMHIADHTHRLLLVPGGAAGGIELLAGDAFLPLGYELLARSACDPERVLLAVNEVAAAMFASAECGGETAEKVRLFASAAACGAIVGGGSEEAVGRLRRFGMSVGTVICERMGSEAAEELRSAARSELDAFDFGEGGDDSAICGILDFLQMT